MAQDHSADKYEYEYELTGAELRALSEEKACDRRREYDDLRAENERLREALSRQCLLCTKRVFVLPASAKMEAPEQTSFTLGGH